MSHHSDLLKALGVPPQEQKLPKVPSPAFINRRVRITNQSFAHAVGRTGTIIEVRGGSYYGVQYDTPVVLGTKKILDGGWDPASLILID